VVVETAVEAVEATAVAAVAMAAVEIAGRSSITKTQKSLSLMRQAFSFIRSLLVSPFCFDNRLEKIFV
jgi:hypothetical protein